MEGEALPYPREGDKPSIIGDFGWSAWTEEGCTTLAAAWEGEAGSQTGRSSRSRAGSDRGSGSSSGS